MTPYNRGFLAGPLMYLLGSLNPEKPYLEPWVCQRPRAYGEPCGMRNHGPKCMKCEGDKYISDLFFHPIEDWKKTVEQPGYCDLPREVQEEFQRAVHKYLKCSPPDYTLRGNEG